MLRLVIVWTHAVSAAKVCGLGALHRQSRHCWFIIQSCPPFCDNYTAYWPKIALFHFGIDSRLFDLWFFLENGRRRIRRTHFWRRFQRRRHRVRIFQAIAGKRSRPMTILERLAHSVLSFSESAKSSLDVREIELAPNFLEKRTLRTEYGLCQFEPKKVSLRF